MLRPEDRSAEFSKLRQSRTRWAKRIDRAIAKMQKDHPRWSQARLVKELQNGN